MHDTIHSIWFKDQAPGFGCVVYDIAKKGDEFFDIMCWLWYWCARVFVN